MTAEMTANVLIVSSAVCGIAFALLQFALISKVKVPTKGVAGYEQVAALTAYTHEMERLSVIYELIRVGAQSFLFAEYRICAIFVFFFGIVIFVLTSQGSGTWFHGGLTCLAFLLGALTSIVAGYVGMMVAVYSNARTTIMAAREPDNILTGAFNIAFRAGSVMGFALCALGIIVLWLILTVYKGYFEVSEWETMMDCVAGYGLGGSSIAMFGRVGGGIYTKAADVGADLVGKVVNDLEEDDPKNPATIADNVGDNVGDVAGMGADLFGSFAEATCAALVIGASSEDLREAGWAAIIFPLVLSAGGVFVCIACSFIATHLSPVVGPADVERALKMQLISTSFVMCAVTYFLADELLPETFIITGVAATINATPFKCFACVCAGTLGGLLIGLITEYYTSHSFQPVRELAHACKQGAAVNLIYGLALGYKSAIIPVSVLACIIYLSFHLCDLFGVALAAIGMLACLATQLSIDGYGPVTDNAGGIAEMSELPASVREKTDCLDAAGNTTAAIGKGFAIGSAALVSLALFGAFVVRLQITDGVNVLEPMVFAFLLIGAMIPYWFAALTMKSVGEAAAAMVNEVQRQFTEKPQLLDPDCNELPDYDACIQISTRASLREMIAPAALVMLTPLLAGTFCGVKAVFGILTGSLVSSVQLAVSMSNSGGAWDNAKKYISGGFSSDPEMRKKDADGKDTPVHKAAVVGDTVGDPFKDTSGPALNIVMKLMAILSLVFAEYFNAVNDGHGLLGTSR